MILTGWPLLPPDLFSYQSRDVRSSLFKLSNVQRGTHVLKALSLGAKAIGVGRYYLFPLAAAGRAGVERALLQMRTEIERGMKLMGCASVSELSAANLRFR
jgi:L-lactate dehydrogenase (cytochrome)